MPCGLFLSLLPYRVVTNDLDVTQCFLYLSMLIVEKALHIAKYFYLTSHYFFPNHSLPEEVTMEQLLDVLGETRLKKMARKNRRSRNQKIREGKVVLNERGEWVDRD